MESEGGEVVEKEFEDLTVDFTKQSLKKIERAINEQQLARNLILDNNEIQRLDNLETYPNLKKLSVVNNQLIRMFGVSHLVQLVTLDLSSNSLVTIEGLKDMKELKYLNLARNRIKTIEHLNKNLKLEKLDLSENNIMHISDLSYLEKLKELNLHGNRLTYLTQCEKNLPVSLEVLTLNNNSIADLNEISHLVQLTSLKELSIVNNPCLDFSEDQKFNYRPFVKNWCSNLVNLDNRPLDDIECLKAEWLYSQGRGRSFRPGEHAALIEYLISVCPKEAEENPENEDVKKLKLILSKAQLHQQQLREQLSSGDTIKPPLPKKRTGLPERMVTSFQDSPSKETRNSPELMTRSLDSGMMKKSNIKIPKTEISQTPLQTSTTFIPIPDTLISPDVSQPTVGGYAKTSSISSRTSRSSSRNSPHSTPETKRKTLMSSFRRQSENTSPLGLRKQGKLSASKSGTPLESGSGPGRTLYSGSFPSDKRGIKLRESERNCRETSEDDDSEALAFKSKLVQPRTSQRRLYKTQTKTNFHEKENVKEKNTKNLERDLVSTEAWKAAICIQRRWRGYRARNLSTEVLLGYKSIQMNRMQDYIMKVVADMEATRIALEGNRKLVILQMQAINALWKKMTAFQPNATSNSSDTKASLQDLVETCSSLSKQVEGLQSIIKSMQSSSAPGSLIPTATQTEIVAVQTPQGEGRDLFPYSPLLKAVEGTTQIGSGDKELEEEEEEEEMEEVEDNEVEELEVREVKGDLRDDLGELREELREITEQTDNSESITTEEAVKTVKELYTNCNAQGRAVETSTPATHSESVHDHSSLFLGGKLEKPCLRLSNELVVLATHQTEEFKEEPESANSSP